MIASHKASAVRSSLIGKSGLLALDALRLTAIKGGERIET
jgi:hypothetical protein